MGLSSPRRGFSCTKLAALVALPLVFALLGVGRASAKTSPSFTLSTSPNSISLYAGGNSAGTSITATALNGFTSNVSIALSGIPSGVTTNLWPTVGPNSSVTLTLTAGVNAAPGNYTVTVTGTSGSLTSKTTIALAVVAPSFTLSSSASSFALSPGQNAWNQPVTISASNCGGLVYGAVSYAASGAPAGVTVSIAGVSSTSANVTFSASSTVTAGIYPITVTGTSGETNKTLVIALQIGASPSFSLSASAGSASLVAGGTSASSTISVVDQGGFTGNVNLSVSGLPSGVSGVLSAASTGTTSTLTLTAGSTAVAGTYPVTVTGVSGSLSATTSIALTITKAQGFSLSLSPSSLSLVPGGGGASSTIGISGQNGFTGSVSLSVSGLPAGVTSSLSAASTTSTSSLTLTASSAAVAGSYSVTVTGTSGSLSATTSIALTIQGAQGFSLSLSPSALSLVSAGAGASSTIGISGQNGFAGSVSLSVSGLPAGVTSSLSAASTTSTSSLTLTASSAAVAGTYSATVTGTSGSLTATAQVSLTITSSSSNISISISQPAYGFNVLPGSVRRVFATVTGGVTNGVNWSVAGGATISSATGNWIDVTAPAVGSNCSINTTGTATYSVSSASQFTVTAQSQEAPNQTATITVNICKPAVQVNVVPFYTTLYSDQKADLQSFVWGSVNRNVTWAITSEPNGGDGALADSGNQDAVFSATVAGRYTVTATSIADGTKTNTATIFVTGHSMPYSVTPSETMPVDCTVDPALTGSVYDVGPSQTYKTIQSVPWSSLVPGSTVRIHNEDTTGGNPTTYHEFFQVTAHASRTQPVRVCGVPDSEGNLPVIDGSNATGSSSVSSYSAGYTVVGIGTTGWGGLYTGTWTGSEDLIVEGLKIQNAKPAYSYTTPSGAAGTAWILGAACIRLFPSMDTVVRGIDAGNCSNGFFADFNANNGFAQVANTLYEGNHLHNNGDVGSYSEHQFYIQGWNEVVEFNLIDQYTVGAEGSNFKGRGYPEILRYNHFGDGAARQIDLVDNQDNAPYTTFVGYLGGGTNSYRYIYSGDGYTADLLAAAVEVHHADYVYGNTFVNASAQVPIHYSEDMETQDSNRLGTLWFFNNSFYEPDNTNYGWYLFDTAGAGGDDGPMIEWPQIQLVNNAIWMDSPTAPYFSWNRETNQFTIFSRNVVDSNWGSGSLAGGFGTGWSPTTSSYAFQGASNAADNSGVSNLVGTSSDPFDVTTFVPNPVLVNAGVTMPSGAPALPVRFQYGPSAIPVQRTNPLTIGAME